MTDELKENRESPVRANFEKTLQCYMHQVNAEIEDPNEVYSFVFMVHSKLSSTRNGISRCKDELDFRSIYSLNSKRKKAAFKDVISSIHLKGISYFKELVLSHSLLLELLC